MPNIKNITDIYFSKDNTDSIIELNIFKKSLSHALFIPISLFNKILKLKSSNNIYDIFTLSFENSGLSILNLGNSNYNIEKILVQKSLKFKKKYYVAFNIIGYYLKNLANNLLSWNSLIYFNDNNYNYIDKGDTINGSVIVKNNMKKIRIKISYTSQTENNNVNMENLINTISVNKLLGYKNEIESSFEILPLIKPYSTITVDSKLIKNNILVENNLIEFDNNTGFSIPALNYNDEIKNYNINMRPIRYTNIIENVEESETIMFNFSSTGINSELYNKTLDIINSKYKINFNVITIKFRNNFSSDQIDNRILINKYTNRYIDTERKGENNEIKKNNINISGWTRNYFLTQKLHGITENRFQSVFNLNNIRFNLIVINNSKDIIDLYFQNNSLNVEKGIYNILDKIENVDYNNDSLILYPKSKANQDGKKGLVKFILNNCNLSILNNVIIDDSVISIAGVKVSNDKLLVNLNMNLDDGAVSRRNNLLATYSNKIYYQPIGENFFYKLKIEQQLITNKNFVVTLLNGISARGSYISGSLNGTEFFKNPLLSPNKLIETFRYKTFITDSNNNIDINFERINLSDKTLVDLSENNVTLLSKNNPDFRISEENILYFDTSDSSNKSKTIRFYNDISCNHEIFNDDGYTLAEYSRNYESGEMGGYISIKVPEAENENSIIYYKVVNLNSYISKTSQVGKILIDNIKEIERADILVNDIYNTNDINYNSNNGLITYDNDPNHFYKIILADRTADMSFNEIYYSHNFLNNIEFKNITNEGNIEISSKNVYNFGVDNVVIVKNSFNVFDNTMYFNNSELKHGIIRVGIIDATKVYQDSKKNYLLVNRDNNDKIVKKYPATYESNIERPFYNNDTTLNNNTKNDSDYIIYFTSHHTVQNRPRKANNVAKLSNNFDDVNVDFSGNTSNWYYSGPGKDLSNNLYLVNYGTSSCLVEIVEDSVGNIIKCSKVNESDRILGTPPNTSSALVTAYKSAYSISATSGWVGLDTNYIGLAASNTTIINIAFARKKLPLETTLKINNIVDTNSELFLFEPLDYSGNINRGINGNYYTNHYNERPFLVGFFDDVTSSTIRLFQVKINTDVTKIKNKNYYSLIDNTDIVDISNSKPYYSATIDSWYSYNINNFGLFETVPHDLIDLYFRKIGNSFVAPRSVNTYDFGVFDFLSLDIREYCDYTLEIEHYKNWFSYSATDSPYIQYTLYKKDFSSDLSYIDICSNTVTGNINDIKSDYNLVREFPQRTFKIDSSGNLLYFPTNDSFFKLDHKKTAVNPIPNNYYILFQFQNNITNDFLNDIITDKFFNYNISADSTKRPFGGEPNQIVTVNGKTVLNIGKMNTIGKSTSKATVRGSGTTGVIEESVTWDIANDYNIEYSGGEVLRIQQTSDGWNSYAHSTQTITRSDTEFQGVKFQIVASQASNYRGGSMVGLGHTTTWSALNSYKYIQFALFDYGGTQRIYEGSSSGSSSSPSNSDYNLDIDENDICEVRVNPFTQKVEYLVNNNVFYTSTKDIVYPLYVKVSLGKSDSYQGAGIKNVQIYRATGNEPVLYSTITDNSFNEFLIGQDPSLNLVINRQSSMTLKNTTFKITPVDNDTRTKIGQGEIVSFLEEFNFGSADVDPSGAFTGIQTEKIDVNVVNITKIFNLQVNVRGGKNVYLSWDFSNDNTTVLITYEIWRKQGIYDYVLIATTTSKTYVDTTPIPFIVAAYKVRCLLTWETESLGTEFVEKQILVCENNNFPFGRYNNTTDNTKLYKPLNNSKSCRSKSTKKTGNLFPNSTNSTNKQIYTILSKNSKRPFR